MTGSKRGDLPRYQELIYPTLTVVGELGGSARGTEITDALIEKLGVTDDQLAVTYEGRDKPVLVDRMEWARSYAKLAGALDSPQRGLFVLSTLGRQILSLPEAQGRSRIAELNREVRVERRRRRSTTVLPPAGSVALGSEPAEEPGDAESAGDNAWREVLLSRLHRLSPSGFEEFALYVLRSFGLELTRVGGTGDQGIDGIGLAPISPVLSSRVAVQAKRHDPAASIGREIVALFQRDAAAAGAERAVLVTLARFSPAARKAATTTTPTVDLIDGDRLCDLVRDQQIGVHTVLQVDESWFDRFDA